MLQPSPQLLVRPAASIAASLRLLTHPKLPLTPAESRLLLNSLTTSFRHQLEQEHGERPAKISEAKAILEARTTKDATTRNGTHASRHMSDILTDPLFRPAPASDLINARDPMDVFDKACAKGLMTFSRARACLIAKKASLKTSKDGRSAIRAGNSGAKVFRWMLSNGAKEHSSWLLPVQAHKGNTNAMPDIVFEFLVLEGREQVLWDLFEHHVVNRTKNAKVDVLLYHLSRTLARRDSMDAAYQSLIKAKGILQEHGFSENISVRVLKKAVESLVQATFGIWRVKIPGQSDALFEDFVLKVEAGGHPALHKLRLALYHPSKPDAKPSLKFLRQLASQPSTEAFDGGLVYMALETAKVLLEQEQHDDAKWVMKFLEERCASDIGYEARSKKAEAERRVIQMESEESNLKLLDSLNFVFRPT